MSTYPKVITDNNALTTITYTITGTMSPAGAAAGTLTLSGTSSPSPTTLTADASGHAITVNPQKTLTMCVQAAATNKHLFFNVAGTLNSCLSVTTPAASGSMSFHLYLIDNMTCSFSGSIALAPVLHYTKGGNASTLTLNTTPAACVLDDGTAFTYYKGAGSFPSINERYQIPTANGTASAGGTIAPVSYHNYRNAFAYSVLGGGSPAAPTLSQTLFGATVNTALTTSFQNLWADVNTACSASGTTSDSTSLERWQTQTACPATPQGGASTTFVYNHQYFVTPDASLPSFSCNESGAVTTGISAKSWCDSGTATLSGHAVSSTLTLANPSWFYEVASKYLVDLTGSAPAAPPFQSSSSITFNADCSKTCYFVLPNGGSKLSSITDNGAVVSLTATYIAGATVYAFAGSSNWAINFAPSTTTSIGGTFIGSTTTSTSVVTSTATTTSTSDVFSYIYSYFATLLSSSSASSTSAPPAPGQTVMLPNGIMVTVVSVNPDGSLTVRYPDGSTATVQQSQAVLATTTLAVVTSNGSTYTATQIINGQTTTQIAVVSGTLTTTIFSAPSVGNPAQIPIAFGIVGALVAVLGVSIFLGEREEKMKRGGGGSPSINRGKGGSPERKRPM